MNEFDFIRHYLHRQQQDAQLILGIGDDAAIIRPRAGFDLHFSSDMLLASRHFFADVKPADLAHKILAVNLSDMAAMGASPRWVLLSAALPQLNASWLQQFCDAFFNLAQRYGVTLIGGDTTRGDWVFNITIVGETETGMALKRSEAQVGDDIWVSGTLGLAAAALAVAQQKIALPTALMMACEQKLLRPEPRVALGQQLLPIAHAAQDISDGLAQDMGHILRASQVGASINIDAVPTLPALRHWASTSVAHQAQLQQWMLAGGDDYELIFTAPVAQEAAIRAIGQQDQLSLTRIGKITAEPQLLFHDQQHQPITLTHLGFDHFRED